MQSAASFATDLLYVRRDQRAREAFGFGPAALAFGAAIVAGGLALDVFSAWDPDLGALWMPGVAVLAALAFGAWELRRRARAASLVRVSGQLGVYRGERLAQVLSRAQIATGSLGPAAALQLVAAAVLGVVTLGAGLVLLVSSTGLGLACLGGAAGLVGAFASGVYARTGCRLFVLQNGERFEPVMLTRADASRLGL